MVGEFNLSLEKNEVWGSQCRKDPLGLYFNDFFHHKSLKDIRSDPSGPTWENGQWGSQGFSKMLDKFLV